MPEPLERFARAPERPPDKVIRQLQRTNTAWQRTKVGHDGQFPNGGIWRFEPGLVVKRIGAQFPGGDPIWRNSNTPGHPHWWVREADFYRSDLATTGWGPQAKPAHCYDVTDGPAGTIELWLQALRIPSHQRDTYEKALSSLAHWQLATAKTTAGWLSNDWIPSHLRRRGLDNAATLAHVNWPLAIDHGLDPRVREAVRHRVTDPGDARQRMAKLPQVLTHYDFHNCNIGRTPNGEVRIIDWAYVGWGPIGQDVGHLAIDAWDHLGETPQATWDHFVTTYIDALRATGWTQPSDEVRHSIAVSTGIRQGWMIDYLLEHATALTDELWPSAIQTIEFVADLIDRLPGNSDA